MLKNNTAENQYTLLTLLVKTAALGNFTGPGTKLASLPGSMVDVPGILAKGNVNGTDVELMPYFTGELATTNVNGVPTGVNWLDTNATMLVTNATYVGDAGSNGGKLFTHLIEYFGAALGCSQYGMSGFPAYAGDNSMTNVHRFMDLNAAQVTWFIQNVGLSAKSFGAADADITAVGMELSTLFNYRCAPATKVIPNTPAELQAICLASSCPISPNATCAAYTNVASTVATASTYMPASSASGSMSSASASMSSGMASGSATAASSGMASSTSGMAASTGAAVANGVSGVLALVAGAAAFAL
ncbi:MAG: hypothetical protein INR71_12380 [Terriglobus roseus]|nr:hypothetical protein [Terriglobus roseus]